MHEITVHVFFPGIRMVAQEPTDLQVRETRAGSISSTAGRDSHQTPDQRKRRRRSGTAGQVVSVAYNRQMTDERIEFSVPREKRTSAAKQPQKADGHERSSQRNGHQRPPLHSSGLHSVDQSFPLLDPLLSYTHETYLGTPTTEYLTSISPGLRLAASPLDSMTENAGNGGGDGGSLDGFEWDNYDETQIKPEHDDHDDDDWLSTTAAIAESGVVLEDDDESFADVFKHDSRLK